jgi:hypothetical protein
MKLIKTLPKEVLLVCTHPAELKNPLMDLDVHSVFTKCVDSALELRLYFPRV